MSTDTFRRFAAIHARLGDLITEAMALQGLCDEAYTAAVALMPTGYPTGSGEPVAGGGTGNPTLGDVLERERLLDSVERTTPEGTSVIVPVGTRAITTSLNITSGAFGEVRRELNRIVSMSKASDPTIGLQPGAGTCVACRRWIPGGVVDRIRSGFCRRDYERWRRANRPDRLQFVREIQLEFGIIEEDDEIIWEDDCDQK